MNMTQPSAARPFTRVVVTPAGWPWDQARMARLEARHTSPVSDVMIGDDLHIVVQRLGLWKPGTDGRFVAVYLRGSDMRAGQTLTVEVQGQSVKIALPSAGGLSPLSDRTAILIAGLIVAACLVVQVDLLWQRRQDADARLSAVEAVVERQSHDAAQLAAAQADAQDLAAMGVHPHTVDDVVQDLNTISVARNADARVQAFLWDDGHWAIEVSGTNPPVSLEGFDLERSPAPIRPDVWLWTPADHSRDAR